MKRNSMRLLSLALTLVMLLGAVPFAAAAAPAATIDVIPGDTVWEGTPVDLALSAPTGYTLKNVEWNTGLLNEEVLAVTPTETTTYSAEYDLDGATPVKDATVSQTITVKEKSKATFAVVTATATVGEEVVLEAKDFGDSNLTWSGEGVSNGKFTATEAGEYEVSVTAENDPANSGDNKTVTGKIVASVATYTVKMDDVTITTNDKTEKLTYSAKKGNDTVAAADMTHEFSITAGGAYVEVDKTSGKLTPLKAGIATAKVFVSFKDGETATAFCTVTVSDNGVIVLKQDGDSFDEDEIDLDFSVVGPGKNDEVVWNFEVEALNIKSSTDKSSPSFVWSDSTDKKDKRNHEVEEDGPEIEVELTAKKGYGIAKITAYADWTGSSAADAEGVFYVSFYDDVNISVTLADGVKEFDFDEDEYNSKPLFTAVTVGSSKYTATQLKTANLAEILTDEQGRYIELDEGSRTNKNEDVGEITSTKTSSAPKYDPDKANTYEMKYLKYLNFDVEDEGTFQVDYVQYDVANGDTLKIAEGTLKILVGEGASEGDITYKVESKGEVTLDEDDFEEFWEDYCDDEDINDDLGWVTFSGFNSITGAMYAEDGDKVMKTTYKFHFDYDDDEDTKSTDFDLTEVVYKAASNKSDEYTDYVDFVCYSEDGTEDVSGTIEFVVGKGTATTKMNFTDVKTGDWFYDAVEYVYTNGIMAGTSTTKFSPNSNLTRGMVVTMLYRVENEPTVTAANKFTDVANGDYFYNAVRWAANNGIVNGTTDTTFAPNVNITREQLAAILYRYAGYKKMDTAATKALTGYPDASSVSDYATTAMKWAVTKGIISGDNAGKLNPKGTATRAEAATMFQRFLAES